MSSSSSGVRTNLFLATLAFASTIAALMQTLVLPLLPQFPGWFGASIADSQWIATSTMLTGAIAGPLFGWLGDRIGMRRMLLVALGFLVVGSVISALAPTLAIMLCGRVLQGFSAGVTALALAMARTTIVPEKLPWAVGVVSGTMGVGTGLGVPLAGVILEWFPWQMVFWITAGCGVVAIVLVATIVPAGARGVPATFDLLGAIGLSAILVLILLPLSMITSWGIGSPLTIGLLAAGVAVAVWWGFRELRVVAPFVDLRLAVSRTVLSSHLVALFMGIGFFLSFTSTVYLVQSATGDGAGLAGSVLLTGIVQTPASIASIIAPIVAAIVVRRSSARQAVIAGALVATLAFGARMVILDNPVAIALTAMLVSGAASFTFTALPLALMNAVPVGATGSANGLNVMMRQIGAASASVIAAVVLSASLSADQAIGAGTFRWMFAIGALVSATSVVIMLTLGRGGTAAAPVTGLRAPVTPTFTA